MTVSIEDFLHTGISTAVSENDKCRSSTAVRSRWADRVPASPVAAAASPAAFTCGVGPGGDFGLVQPPDATKVHVRQTAKRNLMGILLAA
jgi:hypothetical protein